MLRTSAVFVLALVLASCAGNREPFYGPHQAGITTGPQKFAFVAAFDVTASTAEEVRGLLKAWTRAAEALTQGTPLGSEGSASLPPTDTGEVLGYRPARLTLTFGVGPSLFDGRFGLENRRPRALTPLPAFAGDQLRAEWSDGDLVVQAAADDYATAYHALHTLSRAAKGSAVIRWVHDGFAPGTDVNPQGPGRNLQGFIDGTVNPDTSRADEMDRVVWADRGSDWMAGGSYLVVRKIRMFVEVWDRSTLGDQERTIGRDRAEGQELPALSAESHVLQARGAGAEKILRRPFHYVDGLDGRTGQWSSGLLFLAWMKDPGLQFVPMQTRLSNFDLLNEYIQVQGSAVFAVFPGVAKGSYLGAALFPEPPLASRIEALQAAVGAVYPALAREDWTAVRTGAAAWNSQWKRERAEAGSRAGALDALRDTWALALAAETPDPTAVRRAQGKLVRALVAWQAEAAPKKTGSVTELQPLKTALTDTRTALEAGNAAAARAAFATFQKEWVSRESLVRGLDSSTYGAVELGIGAARTALAASPPTDAAGPAVQALSDRLAALKTPTVFGAWDAGFLLFREGLEALLVLAALLAFLGRSGQTDRIPWVWAGAGAGLAASAGVAVLLSMLMTGWIGASAPTVVEGITGLAAVVLMLTVGAWLHGKSSVKNWNAWLKDQMGKTKESPWALAALAFLAILREGAETVVFFWGLAGSISTSDLLLGMGGALAVLAVLGILMIGFARRLPLSWFFPAATALIYYLAVKILGQSLAALQSSGWIPATPLGFGGEADWLGFTATWETAVPQILLLAVLTALVLVPILKGWRKNPPKPAT